MRTSILAVMAVLGLATWQIAPSNVAQPVPAFAPSPSLADGADATGVDNARLAQGGNATDVETPYRVSEGSNATGVDNARFADGGDATGVETQYRTAEGANASGVDNGRTLT